MNDHSSMQKARDADFGAWREATLDWQKQCEQSVTLRDTFAAAALTGLLEKHDAASPDQIAAWWPEIACAAAYRWADAMLRERERTNHDAAPAARASESPCAGHAGTGGTKVGVSATGAESVSTTDAQGFGRSNECPCQPFDSAPTTDQERFVRFQSAVMNWISEATGFFHDDVLRTDDARDAITNACSRCWDAFDRIAYPSTNLDAVPEARAEDEMKEPNGSSTGEPGGEPESTVRTGKTNQSASACDGADVPPTPASGGQINRAAQGGQSPAGTGESERRDVPLDDKSRAAGGPAHHISGAEIDALEFVVEEGRIANIHDYGILRSLLIRLRQEWEFRDSPEPIKDDISDRPEPITIDMSQPCMVDPPSGWKWGFPRRYDPAEDGPMKEWLIRNGYPKHLADKGLTCTFTLCDKETADK